MREPANTLAPGFSFRCADNEDYEASRNHELIGVPGLW